MTTRIALLSPLALVLFVACGSDRPASAPVATGPTPLKFEVEGRLNDSASVSAFGRRVAVVWRASTDSQSDVYISVSTDAGEHFRQPVRVNDVEGDARASGEQAPRVVISDAIHVVWPSRRDGHAVIRYARSSDGGRSFSPAVSIAGDTLPGARGWPSVALMFDGAVHAVWLDGRNAAPRPKGRGVPHVHGRSSPEDPSPRQDILHAALDRSASRQESSIASDVCFCCKTAVVTAGEQVLAAWRHIYPGSVRDIAFALSKDRGRTFGPPIRVSDDGWQLDACPDDGPALAADAHNVVYIVWPTLVPGDTPRKGIFYASLVGESFTPRLRLDSGDADAAHPQIAVDDHGNAAVVWDEHANGARRVVLRRLSHGKTEAPQFFEGPGVNYPVVAAAEGHWVIAWTAQQPDGRSIIEGRRIPF